LSVVWFSWTKTTTRVTGAIRRCAGYAVAASCSSA
jgi:hypothetical protein